MAGDELESLKSLFKWSTNKGSVFFKILLNLEILVLKLGSILINEWSKL